MDERNKNANRIQYGIENATRLQHVYWITTIVTTASITISTIPTRERSPQLTWELKREPFFVPVFCFSFLLSFLVNNAPNVKLALYPCKTTLNAMFRSIMFEEKNRPGRRCQYKSTKGRRRRRRRSGFRPYTDVVILKRARTRVRVLSVGPASCRRYVHVIL